MKKKILSGVFALALLATSGYSVNKSMKSDANLNDLSLSNEETQVSSETENGVRCCEDPGEYMCIIIWPKNSRFSFLFFLGLLKL